MGKHKFYSERASGRARSIGFDELKELFSYEVQELKRCGYLDQYFGGDSNDGVGEHGLDPSFRVFASLGKKGLWPLGDMSGYVSDGDLFDIIEYLVNHVSRPVYDSNGFFCGDYDGEAGREYFISRMREVLRRYCDGFELSETGDVLSLVPEGLESLFDADINHPDKNNVGKRVLAAKLLFRMRDKEAGSFQNRKNAVRELADVLEFLIKKSQEKILHKEDERDLFEIANRFGIRHHNIDQKTDYDKDVFLSWIFYYYLASIHACVHLLKRKGVFQSCEQGREEKR